MHKESYTYGKEEFLKIIFNEFFSPDFFRSSEKNNPKVSRSEEDINELWQLCIDLKSPFINPLINFNYINNQIQEKLFLSPLDLLYKYFNDQDFFLNLNPNLVFDTKYYISNYTLQNSPPLLDYIRREKNELLSPSLLFDSGFYYKNFKKDIPLKVTALQHFLQKGHLKRMDPNPLFSIKFIRRRYFRMPKMINPLISYLRDNKYNINKTSEYFDGQYFISQNSLSEHFDAFENKTPLEVFFLREADHSLITARSFNPQYYERQNGKSKRHPIFSFINDNHQKPLNHINNKIINQLNRASNLEPKLLEIQNKVRSLDQIEQPFISPVLRLLTKCLESMDTTYTYLLLVNNLKDKRQFDHIYRLYSALLSKETKLLIISTDDYEFEGFQLSNEYINIDFLDFNTLLSKSDSKSRQKVLVHLVSTFMPKNCVIYNSEIGFNLIKNYGLPLSTLTIFSYLLDNMSFNEIEDLQEYLLKLYDLNIIENIYLIEDKEIKLDINKINLIFDYTKPINLFPQ